MNREFAYLKDTFNDLRVFAAEQHIECDPSFFREIENYLLHQKVRDYKEVTKSKIASRIGYLAILLHKRREKTQPAGGSATRKVLCDVCDGQWDICSKVAWKLLRNEHFDDLSRKLGNRKPGTHF
jgi:hypothetical protein